jgi:hypothetical protein
LSASQFSTELSCARRTGRNRSSTDLLLALQIRRPNLVKLLGQSWGRHRDSWPEN